MNNILSKSFNFRTIKLREATINRSKLKKNLHNQKLEMTNLRMFYSPKKGLRQFLPQKLKMVFGKLDHRVAPNIRRFLETTSPFFFENHFFHKECTILNTKNSVNNNEDLDTKLLLTI